MVELGWRFGQGKHLSKVQMPAHLSRLNCILTSAVKPLCPSPLVSMKASVNDYNNSWMPVWARPCDELLQVIPLKCPSLSLRYCACMLSRFSHVQLFATPWTVACQAPLSMGFSRQENWIGLPCPPPGDLPDPVIEPTSPAAPGSQAASLPLSHQGNLWDTVTLPTYRWGGVEKSKDWPKVTQLS